MNATNSAGERRIVAYVDKNGRSRLGESKAAPAVANYVKIPGMRTSVMWASPGLPTFGGPPTDPVPSLRSLHPDPGGSVFMTLTLPPDSVFASPSFDPAAAAAEQAKYVPGIAERMEPDAPGFHRTDTIDYVTVLSGDVWLVVDDGEVQLGPGDTIVQLGSRHAWQNRGKEPATLAVVLLGARRNT